MSLLDNEIKEQLKQYFNNLTEDIKFVSYLDETEKSKELDSFLDEISELSEKINHEKLEFNTNSNEIKRPISFELLKNNEKTGIVFSGIPGGHEFNSFILAILGLSNMGAKLNDEQLKKLSSITKNINVETFVTLSCTHCPEVIQGLNLLSMNCENINSTMIDGACFSKEANEKNIMVSPTIYVNDTFLTTGAQTVDSLINLLLNV